MDIKQTKAFVERLLENVNDEVVHKLLPEKRLVIDDLDQSKYESRIKIFDIYSLPGMFSSNISEISDNYNSRLKVLAVSVMGNSSIKCLSTVNVGTNYLSTLNPRVLSRYKNMSMFSEKLTSKLVEYNRLKKGDVLAVSKKGEYIFLARQNIFMVLRHLNPTFFGLLVLLSLGEQIIRTASSIAYQRNKEYDFPYFMTIAGAVYTEKYKSSPKAKIGFDMQMAELADLMITLGIKNQEFSANSYKKIQFKHLSMESMAEIASERDKQNKINKQMVIDERLNELAATATLMIDETKYNPHISKEQQIYNKTGFSINNTVVKGTARRRKFVENLNKYREKIVKIEQ